MSRVFLIVIFLLLLPVSTSHAWPFSDKSTDEALASFVSENRKGKGDAWLEKQSRVSPYDWVKVDFGGARSSCPGILLLICTCIRMLGQHYCATTVPPDENLVMHAQSKRRRFLIPNQ